MKNINIIIGIGLLTVTLPGLIVSIYIPITGWNLFLDNMIIGIIAVIIGYLIGVIIGWIWWSLTINYWKIWAFESVKKEKWLHLYRKSIDAKLIWNKDSIFNRTEIKTPKQKKKLNQINEQIILLEEIEKVNFEITTPEEIYYYVNHAGILIEIIIKGIVITLGIYLMLTSQLIIGAILIVLILLDSNISQYRLYGIKTPILTINKKGIEFKELRRKEIFLWDSIQQIKLSKESQFIIIKFLSQSKQYKKKKSLEYLSIPNYQILQLIIETYIDRNLIEHEE